jgi:hypothetical protein
MNRQIELEKKNNLKRAWNISHKYSLILLDNLEKIDIEKIMSIYGTLITELKSQKLEHTNEKYINCWETMINTYNNSFKTQYVNQKKIRFGIKQLNYTTHLNI